MKRVLEGILAVLIAVLSCIVFINVIGDAANLLI